MFGTVDVNPAGFYVDLDRDRDPPPGQTPIDAVVVTDGSLSDPVQTAIGAVYSRNRDPPSVLYKVDVEVDGRTRHLADVAARPYGKATVRRLNTGVAGELYDDSPSTLYNVLEHAETGIAASFKAAGCDADSTGKRLVETVESVLDPGGDTDPRAGEVVETYGNS